jgi:DNA-binding GntR family transcriptional regulator
VVFAALMIELWEAERACCQPDLLDLTKLEAILNECDSLFSAETSFEHERFNHAGMEFHLSVVRAAQNARLCKTYESLNVHIRAMRVYWGQARRPALNSHNEHVAILKSFREGSWEKVKSSLTAHIINSRDDVIRVLNERNVTSESEPV